MTFHKSIKMKSIDVTSDSYAECNEDFNKKDPKFKVGDYVRISKHKTSLLKDTLEIGQKKCFIKNTVPWTYVISELNGETIFRSFYEKELKKLVNKNLE